MLKEPRPLKDLNLLDRFLFAEAMEDPEILKNMLEIILGRNIVFQQFPQTEKEKRRNPLQRFIKLDVWAMDTERAVYDAEVQKENTYNLPKRSRLYQGLIDSDLLPPGVVDFNELNNAYIILITPFDLFGKGLYRYTFQMQCLEVPELSLEDGATRIFLNTRGRDAKNVSPELIELLRYMEDTTEATSRQCKSPRIQDIQKRIQVIKSSEKIGVKYMQAWEEKILDQQKAKAEGLAEGLEQGLEQGQILALMKLIRKKKEKGLSSYVIAEALEEPEERIRTLMECLEMHSDASDEELLEFLNPEKGAKEE